MDKLRRSFRDSFKRRGLRGSGGAGGGSRAGANANRPAEWSIDETSVRAGTCNFNVKYLGCVEVFESRGMQVCEEALKALRQQRRNPVRGILYVSGDGLRVADADNKGLVVDQTVEKVSFCAPDRNHERGFAYICRDGTTRRWMCHGFHAVKESGERLSHAVGCAFAVCLEKKQKRDRDAAGTAISQTPSAASFDEASLPSTTRSLPHDSSDNDLSGTCTSAPGSEQHFRRNEFRRLTLPERILDPQTAKPTAPPPLRNAENPHAIARPNANQDLVAGEASIRLAGGPGSEMVSPFKRSYSLRPGEQQQQQQYPSPQSSLTNSPNLKATGIDNHGALGLGKAPNQRKWFFVL